MRVAAPGQAVFLRPAKAGRFCRGSSLVPERSLPLGSVLAVLVGAPANTVKTPLLPGLVRVCAMPASGDGAVCQLCRGRPATLLLLSFLVLFVGTK